MSCGSHIFLADFAPRPLNVRIQAPRGRLLPGGDGIPNGTPPPALRLLRLSLKIGARPHRLRKLDDGRKMALV